MRRTDDLPACAPPTRGAIHPRRAAVLVSCALAISMSSAPARADNDEQPDRLRSKFSAGRYFYANEGDGTDLNVRMRKGSHTGWIGYYQDHEFGVQWRTGYEGRFAMADDRVTWKPILHLANNGYFAGGLTGEFGKPWYVILGAGKSNGKRFFNLDFNPNDMVTMGLGWRHEDLDISLFDVRGKGHDSGSRRTHLLSKFGDPKETAWQVDLFHQSGDPVDGESINAWGLALNWARRNWGLRLAYDPRQNASLTRAIRLTLQYTL